MRIEIRVNKNVAKPLVWLTKFFSDDTAVVVCKGYGDDWDFFTGLYWDEDKDNDFSDYQDYRLWLASNKIYRYVRYCLSFASVS